MKTFLIIVSTATITWFAVSTVHSLRTGVERLWMISAVKAPGEMALREIQSDMNAGHYETAQAKINAFADTWQRFNQGPDSCSGLGIGDIMVTFAKMDTNQAAAVPALAGKANRNQPSYSETNQISVKSGSAR